MQWILLLSHPHTLTHWMSPADCRCKDCVLLFHPHGESGTALSLRRTRVCVPPAIKCLFNCYIVLLEWSKAVFRLLSTWPTVFFSFYYISFTVSLLFHTLFLPQSLDCLCTPGNLLHVISSHLFMHSNTPRLFISKVCKALKRICQKSTALEQKANYSSYKSVIQASTVCLRMNRAFKLHKAAWLPW